MDIRPILVATALFWLIGCQTTVGTSFQSACKNAGFTAGTAEYDGCVQRRSAEVDRWNRIANQYRGGGP